MQLLVNSESIYSLKLKGEKNIRILFDFQAVDGKEIAILYHCFQEKRTKGRWSFKCFMTPSVPFAERRIITMINVFFPDEFITKDDLYFMCYMVERIARKLKQRNKYVINFRAIRSTI